MKHVRVRITAGGREAEIHPMYDVLINADFVERATALQWSYTGDALAMLHYVEGDADAFRERLETLPAVLECAIEPAGAGACYAYVSCTTTEPIRTMFRPMTEGELVVVPPIRYRPDGTVTYSAFGISGDLQAAIDAVPDPIEITIEEIGGLAGLARTVETRLSDRQREAIEAALELGYYDIPREATHEDVADALGCAPSTAAEHLRKAESKTLRSVYAR